MMHTCKCFKDPPTAFCNRYFCPKSNNCHTKNRWKKLDVFPKLYILQNKNTYLCSLVRESQLNIVTVLSYYTLPCVNISSHNATLQCNGSIKQCSIAVMVHIEGVSQNLRMLNGRFKTNFDHFFTNYINIFHKTDISLYQIK